MQKIQAFCSEDLGGFYLDILKDRLYTAARDSSARRSAQNALYHIAHSLLRLMAPVLSFTADEAWPIFTRNEKDSVLLHTWHRFPEPVDEALIEKWKKLRFVRADMTKKLEELRVAGFIGSSLQAEVEIRTTGEKLKLLESLGEDLKFLFITSSAKVASSSSKGDELVVTASNHKKCERCWHYRADVGSDPAHAEICGRCTENLYGAGERRVHA